MTSQAFSGQSASRSAPTDQINSTGFLMLKRLILAGLLSLVTTTVFAAGTIPFSLSQQFDSLGKPLANCYFYTIQAGTTSTPQNAYQDSALTLAQPNPMRCDASGRLPQFFLADGLIKVRITDKNGVSQAYPNGSSGIDNIQVIGPSSGGGGGGTVDPTTILATGDIKDVYATGVLTGFVRANGRTIGSATSGATERANADTSALFSFLWGQDPNLVVSGGRGASAAADFAANKTIALPDFRSRVRAALSDMGNSDSGLFGPTYCSTSTTLGFVCGGQASTLITANLPPIIPTGTITNGAITASSVTFASVVNGGQLAFGTSSTGTPGGNLSSAIALSQATSTFTGTGGGGTSSPVRTVQPSIFVTSYIKL